MWFTQLWTGTGHRKNLKAESLPLHSASLLPLKACRKWDIMKTLNSTLSERGQCRYWAIVIQFTSYSGWFGSEIFIGSLRYWKGKRKRSYKYFLCAETMELLGHLSKTEKVNPDAFQTLFTSICQCPQFHKSIWTKTSFLDFQLRQRLWSLARKQCWGRSAVPCCRSRKERPVRGL